MNEKVRLNKIYLVYRYLILGVFFMSANVLAKTLDYSHVTSLKIARELAEKGELEKILLFPEAFGGEDIPVNVLYVPLGIAEIKAQLTETTINYMEQNLINKLEVLPTYKGDSFIPATIEMKMWHSDKEGIFNPIINIW